MTLFGIFDQAAGIHKKKKYYVSSRTGHLQYDFFDPPRECICATLASQ